MPAIVITKWATTEAYRADPHIADEGMKLISSCEGMLGNYHGVQIENPAVGFSVQVCTSSEDYLKAVQNQELFGTIMEKLSVTRIGGIEQYHGTTHGDPFKALAGPAHEISYFTLKNGTPEARAQFDETCVLEAQRSNGKMTYAWAVEDPNTILVLYSWDSIEAHTEYASQPEAAEALKGMSQILDMHGGPMLHVDLNKVE